jgi:hypothetical protein
MAITNAQQYQQLVNKPANGKRPGYRGDDAARSSEGTSAGRADPGKSGRGDTRGDIGNDRSSGADDRSSALQTYNQQVATGTQLPPQLQKPIELNKREQEFQNFLDRRNKVNLFGTGKLLETPAQKFSNYNASVNRPFFENVIRSGKIPGVNFATLEDEDDYEKAYQNYMSNRLAGNIDAYGNPLGDSYYNSSGELVVTDTRDDGAGQKILPMDDLDDTEEEVNPRDYTGLAPRFMGSSFDFTGLANGGRAGMMDGGMMEDTPEGGIMDLESGRQMYFLGKLVKKATRAVKKVAKSPFGKAALGAALFKFGGGFGGGSGKGLASFFGKGSFNPLRMAAQATADGPMTQLSPLGKVLSKFGMATGEGGGKLTLGGKLGLGFGLPFALDALGIGKKDDEGFDIDEYYRKNSIDIADIRNRPYNFLAPRFAADGGLMRTGYQEGGDAEPVAKKTMPLLDMDGMEKDYRADGGFVPIGRMERADDVPARLSKNEFVFTADAVRNAGEGDIDKGAEVMYNMMKNLESGGEVSEESQGLDGAKEMFQTSQRLEEVL